ncbi:MAG: cadmium-translocating P-type ATPase [Eubacteriaceae bacterium]|nr:cadmium-translocating P-type ATPase [Eubacteriaceae bacterium]
MNKKQKNLLLRIIIAAVFFVPLYLISEGYVDLGIPDWGVFILFLVPYLLVGYDILKKAFKGIMNKQVFDENFLMTVATIGAIVLGEYGEGVAVMLLYQVGELFQSYAVGKSRKNITELMDIRPDYANIEVDGELTQVDPEEVEVGSIITVQPGEKIPLDGVVVEGTSALNTSALTGESKPVEVSEGTEVLSGSINMTGVLRIETTAEFDESTASKILDLVENAASLKAKSENFISKFARYYTPIVCYAALALAVIPPLAIMFLKGSGAAGYDSALSLWGDWILRACTFLVISCPCAVVISIPLSFFAGIGGASRQGILVKGSNYLETLSEVRVVAFDKTGTITKGNFEVTAVHHTPIDEAKLLEYAAHAECHSSHPIALSIIKAYGKRIDQSRVTDVQEISGHGIIAKVDGDEVAIGNDKLMTKVGTEAIECHHVGTIIHVAINGEYCGHIVIFDELKDNSKEAMQALRKVGVQKTVMLTGDAEAVAKKVADDVGITEYRSQLLPADKVTCVEELLKECGEGHRLAFVGDGINDAPVLSRADIGIAMGAMGSDAAIEAADIVLMDDDPLKIAKAIKISRKCLRIVKQNIALALGVKFICLILAAFGIANMWIAIIADVGVMIVAVLNAIRCMIVGKL